MSAAGGSDGRSSCRSCCRHGQQTACPPSLHRVTHLLHCAHLACSPGRPRRTQHTQTTPRQRAVTGAHSQQVVQWSICMLTLVELDICCATLNGRFTYLPARGSADVRVSHSSTPAEARLQDACTRAHSPLRVHRCTRESVLAEAHEEQRSARARQTAQHEAAAVRPSNSYRKECIDRHTHRSDWMATIATCSPMRRSNKSPKLQLLLSMPVSLYL